jgi:hypothetical protein
MKENPILKALSILFILCSINAETLFEVKDASNNKVLDVSTDGLRILNQGDTLMVISSSEIKANLESGKGLSRSFSVSTTTSKGTGTEIMKLTADSTRFWISDEGSGFGVSANSAAAKAGVMNLLKVSDNTTKMQDSLGGRYTAFNRYNTFIGLNAGKSTVPIYDLNGKNNVFIGNNAGYTNTEGANNVFIGNEAGYKSNENFNVFVGFNSGKENVGGLGNTFVGDNSGLFNSWGCNNAVFGSGAAYCNENGSNNSIFGSSAGHGYYYNSYSGNCLFGNSAGNNLRTGDYNVMMGYKAGYSNLAGSGNVFIGKDAGHSETTSDKLYIENSDSASPLIWGDFANDLIKFNGHVGINYNPVSYYGLYVFNDYYGVMGISTTSTGAYTYGLYGDGNGGTTRNVSIYGAAASGTGANWSGYFNGDIDVIGTVVKASDEVKIDHPSDPKNKYLSHTSINSDQMSNIYHGNVILDSEGNAIVKLQNWVEGANKDFRYQLTAVGSPGPDLYISKEISNSSFEISGGSPNMKVSWQVTGIRDDNYAKTNPVTVETHKKADEKGYYLHPEAYGLSKDEGIEFQIQKKQEKEAIR